MRRARIAGPCRGHRSRSNSVRVAQADRQADDGAMRSRACFDVAKRGLLAQRETPRRKETGPAA